MSDNDLWIVIPNWWKFQHYKDRNPRWIKLYTELLDDPAYRNLTLRLRGLLACIWMLYAAADGHVPASPAYLAKKFGLQTEWETRQRGESVVRAWREHGEGSGEYVVRGRDLKALEQAGFIELTASKPLANSQKTLAQRELLRNSLRARVRASDRHGARTPALEEENQPRANADAYKPYQPDEPSPDPDALARLLELQARIGR